MCTKVESCWQACDQAAWQTVANALLDVIEDGEVLDGQDAVVTQTQSKVYEGVRYDAKVRAEHDDGVRGKPSKSIVIRISAFLARDMKGGVCAVLQRLKRCKQESRYRRHASPSQHVHKGTLTRISAP